jgi:hypothetical protein
MAVPFLSCASENLTINRSDKRKTESSAMRCVDTRSELKICNLTERTEKEKED